MTNLSVLHISDLHRDPENPLRNGILLDSLMRDRERYTSQAPSIQSPDLVIVSGDIVQGVKHDVPNAEATLQHQYEEALEFLTTLADEFVEGDNQRVIIVPGNHDVSDYHSRQSLEVIDVDVDVAIKRNLVEQLFTPESSLRWSWSDLALHKIADFNVYEQRLAAFADFYSSFYEGQRSYSVDPAKQFDMFYFPNWRTTIVGFCSCFNNDLLNRRGAIHPDCVASAGEQLRVNSETATRIAVWHHGIEGNPTQLDYMDPDTVQNFIDGGYSLGFHGHQHRPEYIKTRFRYGIDRRITILSAGTLCGDAAYGFRRAYNLVELDTEEHTGRLHVREMQNDNLQMPIWGAGSIAASSDGTLDFRFDPPFQPSVSINNAASQLSKAAKHYENGQCRDAVDVLLPLVERDDLARPLLLDCLTELGDASTISSIFDPPKSAAEAIALMDALWIQGERNRLREVMSMAIIADSVDGSVIEMRTKSEARLRI